MSTLHQLELFKDERHQPFYWPGANGAAERPAAVLVHGFPGTPAEMRPLASALHEVGWTTKGVLLPGFGVDFATLLQRHPDEWVTAVAHAVRTLQQDHRHVYLIGYSMGGAVSLHAAARLQSLAGLVLIAPFYQVGTWWHGLIWQVMKRLFRQPRPFRKMDFADPRVREPLLEFLPDLDLDDPEVQQLLRDVIVPSHFVDAVLRLGRDSHLVASRVKVPSLIIQGRHDPLIKPSLSHKLFSALAGGRQYLEVDGDHELIATPDKPFWSTLVHAVRTLHHLEQPAALTHL